MRRSFETRLSKLETAHERQAVRHVVRWLPADPRPAMPGALGVGDRVVFLPRKAASADAWVHAVREHWPAAGGPACTD
jgi:hypothetical protein